MHWQDTEVWKQAGLTQTLVLFSAHATNAVILGRANGIAGHHPSWLTQSELDSELLASKDNITSGESVRRFQLSLLFDGLYHIRTTLVLAEHHLMTRIKC